MCKYGLVASFTDLECYGLFWRLHDVFFICYNLITPSPLRELCAPFHCLLAEKSIIDGHRRPSCMLLSQSLPPHSPIFPRKNYILTLQRVHPFPVLEYLRRLKVRAKGTLRFLGLSVDRIKLDHPTVAPHFPGHSIVKFPFKEPKSRIVYGPLIPLQNKPFNIFVSFAIYFD